MLLVLNTLVFYPVMWNEEYLCLVSVSFLIIMYTEMFLVPNRWEKMNLLMRLFVFL